jgi:arginine decarboxylase-like protein
MIGQTILQYKIIEKLGEVPIRLDLASEAQLSPPVGLRIPTFFVGSRRRCT